MIKHKGMTLVEIVIAIALLGIISVGFISVFGSQLSNIVLGSNITVDAFEEQGVFEALIFNVKEKIQKSEPLSSYPEWSEVSVEILGETVLLQRLKYDNPGNNKDMTVYLSNLLAETEIRNMLTVENVLIQVSNDPSNEIADLSTAPTLTADYSDNSGQPTFYDNLFKWWRADAVVEESELVFPDDFSLIPVPLSTSNLDDLLDSVGANSYVMLTVTPVDIHGFRGTPVNSSNIVFVKGNEWRTGAFPWVDMNNTHDFDTDDHQLVKESIIYTLDARSPYPNPLNVSENISLEEGSLFVPMRINPAVTLEPGNEPIIISNSESIQWLIERNINIAKDVSVENGSDIIMRSGYGSNGGNIVFYPYVRLNPDGTPVETDGVIETLTTGVSLSTTGNAILETMGRGSILFYGYVEISAENIAMTARGNIGISNSSLSADNNIIIDNYKDLSIYGSRKISFNEVDFDSPNSDKAIQITSPEAISFKGGSWSANQMILVPNGSTVTFEKGDARVNNLGPINLGNTSRILFRTSMLEDVSNQMRLNVVKVSDDTMQIVPHNYLRNIGYANSLNNIVFTSQNTWKDIGQGQNNIEFSGSVLSGEGDIDDIKFAFDGNDEIQVLPNSTTETDLTVVKLEFRDKYSSNQIKGAVIVKYSIDASGDMTIEVEEIPINTYFITFNSNGGTPVDTMTKAYGDPIAAPPVPVKLGHTFAGWNPALPAYMPDYDLEVDASWTPNEYTVTLFGEGGVPVEQTKSVTYGQTYGILLVPTRSGYSHLGWWTTRSGEGVMITGTEIYDSTSDQSLYSRWTEATYTVTFNSNGGNTPVPSQKPVTFNGTYGDLPPDPGRPGYNFSGWFTAPSGGTQVQGSTQVTATNNHTLYAHWVQVPELTRTDFSYSGRSTFTLTFSNNIIAIVRPPTTASLGTPSIASKQVTFSGLNVSTGSYVVEVLDEYGQNLTVNLTLSRFIFWYYWSVN